MGEEATKHTPLTATGAPTFHPKRENISFGRWAMPVMAEKMHDKNASTRVRALQSLCDYVYDSKRIASKEFESVAQKLKDLHTDVDEDVRLKVAECFAAIVATAAGRRVFLKKEFFKEAVELLNDDQEDVRFTTGLAMLRFSVSPDGTEALIKAGAIETMIERIPKETEKVLIVLLQALHRLCLESPDKALEKDALPILTTVLQDSSPSVKTKASTLIKDLTIEASGRNQALQLCEPLLKILSEEDDESKAKALSAIMMIVNSTEGKFAALENSAIEKILPLLGIDNPEIKINALQVLTALAETSKGKRTLLEKLNEVFPAMNDDIVEIQKAAKRLIEVAKLKP